MSRASGILPMLLLTLGCASAGGSQQRSAVLTDAAPMGTARAAHTATALPDGRVLVAGGFTGEENSAAGAEIYDPSSGRFAPSAPMIMRRHSHSATPLPDGRILLAGGYSAEGNYLASAELYDPATSTFVPTGPMGVPRADHVAVLLRDGRVLMIGGVSEGWTFLSSAELYDPATGRFSPTGAMHEPRESHAAVRLHDGRVLVVGGHRGRGASIQLYRSAEIYDPAAGTFAPAAEMAIRRHKHDAVLLPSGLVLVSGGTDERDNDGVYRSTELFDPAAGVFRAGGDMRVPRYKHRGTSIVLGDGRVLLAGGATQAELYEPRTGTFAIVGGDARMAGQFSATAPLPRGGVLITGGYGGNRGPRNRAWVFRPSVRKRSW